MKSLLRTAALAPLCLLMCLATLTPLTAAPPSGGMDAHGWPRDPDTSTLGSALEGLSEEDYEKVPASTLQRIEQWNESHRESWMARYGSRFELGNQRWEQFIPPFKASAASAEARVATVDRSGTFPRVTFTLQGMRRFTGFNGKLDIGKPLSEDERMESDGPFPPLTDTQKSVRPFLEWNDANRPVPLIPGQKVYLGLDAQNRVTCFLTYLDDTAGVAAIRRAPDGEVEVIVKTDDEDEEEKEVRFLHVKPNFTDLDISLMYGLLWTEKSGLVLTSLSHHGGDEAVAMESLPRIQKRGIPIANVPDMRVVVGEDGWHLLKEIPVGPTFSRAHIIPERQFMSKWYPR